MSRYEWGKTHPGISRMINDIGLVEESGELGGNPSATLNYTSEGWWRLAWIPPPSGGSSSCSGHACRSGRH